MSITIDTLKHRKTYKATIDGVDFEVRPFTTAETIALQEICEKLTTPDIKKDIKQITRLMSESLDIYYGIYNDKEKAAEVLKNVDLPELIAIYNEIMKAGEQ